MVYNSSILNKEMRIVSLISYTVYSHLQEEDLDEKKDLKSSEKNESHI